MELLHVLLAALAVALVLTGLFSSTYRGGGAWTGLWVFFLVILLFALAGGIWTAPYGPVYGGINWFGIIFWAVLVALALAAFRSPRRGPREAVSREQGEDSTLTIGTVFWILIAVLVVGVIWGAYR